MEKKGEAELIQVVGKQLAEKIGKFSKKRSEDTIDADLVVISCIKYLHEARKWSYLDIGDRIGLSRNRVAELRFAVDFPKSPTRRLILLQRLKEVITELKEQDKLKGK